MNLKITASYDQSQDLFDCVVRDLDSQADSTIIATVIVRYHTNRHCQIDVLTHGDSMTNSFELLGQVHAQVLEAIDAIIYE